MRTFILILFLIFTRHAYAKNILIIGGSAGIGKALVEVYAEYGYNVYATYNSHPSEKLHSNVSYLLVDLLQPNSVEQIVTFVDNILFDIIIYNAGKFGYQSNSGPILDRQDWLDSFIINTIIPIELGFALTNNFHTQGGKYVVITSRRASNTINIADKYIGRYSYRSSKAALNSAAIALSTDLQPKNITVLMLHPGQVKTAMTSYKGIEPIISAQLIKKTIDARSLLDTGKFIDVQSNQEMPW